MNIDGVNRTNGTMAVTQAAYYLSEATSAGATAQVPAGFTAGTHDGKGVAVWTGGNCLNGTLYGGDWVEAPAKGAPDGVASFGRRIINALVARGWVLPDCLANLDGVNGWNKTNQGGALATLFVGDEPGEAAHATIAALADVAPFEVASPTAPAQGIDIGTPALNPPGVDIGDSTTWRHPDSAPMTDNGNGGGWTAPETQTQTQQADGAPTAVDRVASMLTALRALGASVWQWTGAKAETLKTGDHSASERQVARSLLNSLTYVSAGKAGFKTAGKDVSEEAKKAFKASVAGDAQFSVDLVRAMACPIDANGGRRAGDTLTHDLPDGLKARMAAHCVAAGLPVKTQRTTAAQAVKVPEAQTSADLAGTGWV